MGNEFPHVMEKCDRWLKKTKQLDVRGLSNGVYTLRATQMNETASERVVVVK